MVLGIASNLIEEFLGVGDGLEFKARTEYYPGSGTQQLLLRHRPVISSTAPRVFVDSAGYFGSASGAFDAATTELTYGTDFALKIDQSDGTSRSGILIRINDLWKKPQIRQVGYLSPFVGPAFGNVKVIYSAGYTTDGLPAAIRNACHFLTTRLIYLMPVGHELTGEGYEEKSLSFVTNERSRLMQLVAPMLMNYKNWRW